MPESIAPKVLSWASELEPDTADQAVRLSQLPFIFQHVALMPDAHLGKGATVGSVIATQGALVPAAVGVDLGCGMLAVQTNIDGPLPDLTPMLDLLVDHIPAGLGRGHASYEIGEQALGGITANHPKAERDVAPLVQTAASQFGTLGSGNHFLEVHRAAADSLVWLIVHSGSRGVGNKLAQRYIAAAGKEMGRWFIQLEDPDLAYLPQGSDLFGPYLAAVGWAQEYAWRNREQMIEQAIEALHLVVGGFEELSRVHCHHNYTQMEHHMGVNVWVTRKGAVSARQGELSVLPGSMGTNSYIVEGLGNPASFMSAPHGAGRRLSRGRARRELTVESMKGMMAGRVWLESDAQALLDEHPDAYKPISQVLEDSADLVRVVHELTPVLNFKGL